MVNKGTSSSSRLLSLYRDIYIESKIANLKVPLNRAEMAKIRHTNTGKISRRQGKPFLFNSCPLFLIQTNTYKLRHCVTLIVTLKLQRSNKGLYFNAHTAWATCG